MTKPKNIASALVLSAVFVLGGCASSEKRMDYPATANSVEEIQTLDTQMMKSAGEDTAVLSPMHFEKAREHLAEAKKKQSNGDNTQSVLKELGFARAHFDSAQATAEVARQTIPEVLKTRTDAISARASEIYNGDFRTADNELKDWGKEFEKNKFNASVKERNELNQKYSNLELRAIRKTQLGRAESILQNARKNDAKKNAPQTLTDAELKYNSALAVIDANRHSPAGYNSAVTAANSAADKLGAINDIVRNSKGKSQEQIALEIQHASDRIDLQKNQISQANTAVVEANAEIQKKEGVISAIGARNAQLSKRERLDKSLERAQALFSKDEAEVYRQGDQLLIRLKMIQFPSGRTELPQTSFSTLAKTKEVIEMLGAQQVTVQGHTDSIGAKEKNMKLSEGRASAVASYLSSDVNLSKVDVKSEGYGFAKPLTSNKTASGRAQNRRVDLVVVPSESMAE